MAEKKKGKKAKRDLNYYASRATSKAERLELSRAGERTGLDDEIALLRLRLKEVMAVPPGDKRACRDVRILTETL